MVNFTTSRKCKDNEMSTVRSEETGELLPMKISFWARPCANKMAYAMYKVCRVVYVGWYFYFTPFCTIVLSFLLPTISTYLNQGDSSTAAASRSMLTQ